MADTFDRRRTRFPSAQDSGRRGDDGKNVSEGVSEAAGDSSKPKPQAKLKRKRGVSPPPRLPLKVNTAQVQQVPSAPEEKDSFWQRGEPWQSYLSWMDDDQAGPVSIAHKQDSRFQVVAIKKRALTPNMRFHDLKAVQHENIVHLQASFRDASTVYLVYESIKISLREMQACAYGPFKDFEISSICKQVRTYAMGVFNAHSTSGYCRSPLCRAGS